PEVEVDCETHRASAFAAGNSASRPREPRAAAPYSFRRDEGFDAGAKWKNSCKETAGDRQAGLGLERRRATYRSTAVTHRYRTRNTPTGPSKPDRTDRAGAV